MGLGELALSVCNNLGFAFVRLGVREKRGRVHLLQMSELFDLNPIVILWITTEGVS